MKKLLPLWLILGVLLCGCETSETLVGRWQGPRDRPDFILEGMWEQIEKPLFKAEFFEDGTFAISVAQPDGAKKFLEGRYQQSDSVVELHVTGLMESGMRYSLDEYQNDQLSIKGRLRGNRLSLIAEYGIVIDLFTDFKFRGTLKDFRHSVTMDFEKVNFKDQ